MNNQIKLTEEQKNILLRKIADGKPSVDIAKQLGISLTTVYYWKKRFIDNLPEYELEKEEKKENDFATQSLQIAAILFLMGKKIKNITNGLNNKKNIYFELDEDINEIVKDYFDYSLQCSPYSFYQSLCHIKKSVFNENNDL